MANGGTFNRMGRQAGFRAGISGWRARKSSVSRAAPTRYGLLLIALKPGLLRSPIRCCLSRAGLITPLFFTLTTIIANMLSAWICASTLDRRFWNELLHEDIFDASIEARQNVITKSCSYAAGTCKHPYSPKSSISFISICHYFL